MSWPEHIAIIMDGNGRWAAERGRSRITGHREGARNLERITTLASNLGIKILTVYAFSAENWSRPRREVELLMQLIRLYAIRKRPLFMANSVRVKMIGDPEKIPSSVREALDETTELTKNNTGLLLQLALSYGGRDEILRAVRKILATCAESEKLTEEAFSAALDTKGQKDPDLVIRTSGEERISNFLLWQSAYSEYYFTSTHWPDFSEEEFMKALDVYSKRLRRFGGVTAETQEVSL